MDERVKEEYERLLASVIIANGVLVRESAVDFMYGWMSSDDYEGKNKLMWTGRRHSDVCGIKRTGKVNEDCQWDEFKGTFYEGDTTVYGVEVEGVTCNCGKLINRSYRWAAPLGEAIKIVMEALLEEKFAEKEEEDS